MSEARRRDYLEALGVDVWISRPAAPAQDRLLIGQGEGSILLVCESPSACSGKLAGDIVRALGGEPVWAWLDPNGGPDSEKLDDAIAARLLTRVIVFGTGPATLIFGANLPSVMGSAAITRVSSLDELAVSGSKKQAFWASISSTTEEVSPATRQ